MGALDHPEDAPKQSKKGKAAAAASAAYPGLPQPPHTALKFFNKETKPKVKAANPNASSTEFRKLMSAAWKDCKGTDKERFVKMAAEAQQKYNKDMAVWRKQNPALAAKYDQDEKERKAGTKSKKGVTSKPDGKKQTTIKTESKKRAKDEKEEPKKLK